MKNKLLLSSLLSLSILTFSGTAKAQESADATFTGTLSASVEIEKVQDGVAIISPTTGVLEGIVNPIFTVTSSQEGFTEAKLTVAPVSGALTLANPDNIVYIALTKGTPAESAINDALSTAPVAPANPDVIAYIINVIPDGQPNFVFFNDALQGIVLDEPGTNNVNVQLVSEPRGETFDENDSAGEYTAQLTLTAVPNM